MLMGQVVLLPSVPVYPASTTFLDTAECAFLIAVRWWVSGYQGDEDPVPRLCRGLKIAGARDAAFTINEFMAVIASTAREPIAIHQPRCLDLSDDERQLLFAASLAQAGESAAAERALRASLVSPAGAESALEPLEVSVELFAQAGLIFSRRWPRFENSRRSDTSDLDHPSNPT
jgi:hypothetical protein